MSDKQIIFTMKGVNKVVPPKKHIIKDIYLSFYYGAKIGIIGHNGSGKSTVLRIMAGRDTDFTGECVLSKGYSVDMLEHEPKLDGEKTVREIVKEGLGEIGKLLNEYDQINNKLGTEISETEMNTLIEKQAVLQEKLDSMNAWDLDARLNLAMEALRCPPDDALIKNLSGGEVRRVALCRLLLKKPDILLLDEPTNHLDAETVYWLQNHLKEYEGTIILITHDRYFLDNITGWILELDHGEGVPWKGNYTSWLEQKQAKLAETEKQESKFRKELARELEWVKTSPKGRHAKSKSRITRYDEMLTKDFQSKQSDLELFIPPGPRLGNVVIESINVKKAFGEKLLYENLNFMLPPGGIIGIVGPNGAGKTTLFKMIIGELEPDEGTFKIGESVKLGYVDQHRSLDPELSVFQEISGGSEVIKIGEQESNARAYISKFQFSGTDQSKKISMLSGGERNRVHLAKLLRSGSNVLLLDEPSNDLDVKSLRALEDALSNFAGCAVVISHDRWFLDRVATHILAFEGNSQVVWFDGNFSEYEENRRKRLGKDAEIPKRLKYKRLTR